MRNLQVTQEAFLHSLYVYSSKRKINIQFSKNIGLDWTGKVKRKLSLKPNNILLRNPPSLSIPVHFPSSA
jgi:hypothetical protein